MAVIDPGVSFSLKRLHLLEQANLALGAAGNLSDFYAAVAGLVVLPGGLGFSRAFFLKYDDRQQGFSGRLAVGGRDAGEHARFRQDLEMQQAAFGRQMRELEEGSFAPTELQRVAKEFYAGIAGQTVDGCRDGATLDADFGKFFATETGVGAGHLLSQIARVHEPAIYRSGDISGLEKWLRFPFVAARLVTNRGLHGIVIADKVFQDTALGDDDLAQFRWLLNLASLGVGNLERMEELAESAERIKEVDRLKTNFLSIMSHELRTPLTSIIGFVHLLAEGQAGPVTEGQASLLKRVSVQSVHLQNMVNDILELAEVESGGMINASLGPVDPLGALLRVIPRVESRRVSRKAVISPQVGTDVPMVRTDPGALERIYYHLLDNAIKFVDDEGRITIGFGQQDDHLRIAITDTGIGIPEENLQKIFDYFYQVDSRMERAFGGMGIGLTIVKMLLDATGGKIEVESKAGDFGR